MTRTLKLAAIAMLSTSLAAPVLAKGHAQSNADEPGTTAGERTVATAQVLGSVMSDGKGKGPQGIPGMSNEAGKPTDE